MKKIVKKYGNTLIVNFTPEDCKIYRIVEGSVIDLSELTVLNESGVKYNAKQVDSDITRICREMKK